MLAGSFGAANDVDAGLELPDDAESDVFSTFEFIAQVD